jgi:hypothetical protein
MQFMQFSGYTHVEVEANDNTPMMAQQVYKNTGVPFPVSHVRIYEGEPDGQLCAITGWTSKDGGSPTTAYPDGRRSRPEGLQLRFPLFLEMKEAPGYEPGPSLCFLHQATTEPGR